MRAGSATGRFLLGVLLSCGLLAVLLYLGPLQDGPGAESGGNFLSKVYTEATPGDLMEKTQDIWGWVLVGLNLTALAGFFACPVKGVSGKKKAAAGLRLFVPGLCGTLVLLAVLTVLCVPALLAGFIEYLRINPFLTVAGLVLLVALMYLLGSRSIPLFRSAEGLGNNFPKGLRIAEGILVALFAGIALFYGIRTMRLYLLPVGILLALLPGTLCEWALAKRRSGLRLMYLCMRTLRGIGLVAFCPVTVPILLYALFSASASKA